MPSKPLPDDWITCKRDVPDLAIGSWADHATADDPLWFMDKTDAEGRERVKHSMAIPTTTSVKGHNAAENAK